jgi:bacillithiol synthase
VGQVFFRNKTYTWQAKEGGAVGRMTLDNMSTILNDILLQLNINEHNGKTIFDIIKKAYTHFKTLGAATQYLLNALFGSFGLVVLDPDNADLKKIFAPVVAQELLKNESFDEVQATNIALTNSNYKPQATARPINIFYLKDTIRERIEKTKNQQWKVVNTEIVFSESELLQELNTHPERFSANVILRGLFQETILPNLAFVGGGGELAYWLQLKNVFALHNIPYPMLVLRQSIQLLNASNLNLLLKLNLKIEDAFRPELALINDYLNTQHTALDFTKEDQIFVDLYNVYIAKAAAISEPLRVSIVAHKAKNKHIKQRVQQKIKAHIKKAEQDKMVQFKKMHQSIFPDNTLQERKLNFIDYYAMYGAAFFDTIYKAILPFGNDFVVIENV